jgi:hypothetical protein
MEKRVIRRNCVRQYRLFDDRTEAVHVIATTESPFLEWYDKYNGYVITVHIVDGFQLPPSSDQIPLVDNHNYNASSVLGSARNFTPVYDRLECDIFFSNTPAAREIVQKLKEGHLTDFSVGYFPLADELIPEGESKTVKGRVYQGPARIIFRWYLFELSITAVGKDINAKVVRPPQKQRSFYDNLFYYFIIYSVISLIIGLLL